jgi:nucleotide-binding universal stress UspA family protein
MPQVRKFLVVADQTPECMVALRFAARRAARTNGVVTMLFVLPRTEMQHWLGVEEMMRREAREGAEARLAGLAEEVRELAGVVPEFVIREGDPVEEIMALLGEDPLIGVLVLGADAAGDNPGPLVSAMVAKRGGRMPIPVTVVPGSLSQSEIDAIS